jgi:general secretion pathway protein D
VLGFGSGERFEMDLGSLGKFNVTSLTGLIRILKTVNLANVLSTPSVMALDNEQSLIEVGLEVPVALTAVASSNGIATPQVERKKVTTKLEITPYISPDTDTVQMKIDQEVAGLAPGKVEGAELAKNSIATSTRKIKTQIVVNSGDTAVLGGLMQDEEKDETTKVPVLGDIPLLGWLFKSKTMSKNKTNLVVFITPKIVRNPAQNSSIVDEKINERIDFIQQNMSGRDPHGKFVDSLPRRKAAAPSIPADAEEPAIETF